MAWLFIAFFDHKLDFIKKEKLFILNFIFMLWSILIPIIYNNLIFAHRYAALLIIPLSPIIYKAYNNSNRIIIIKCLIILTLIFSIITYIFTSEALLIDPYISRSIKSSGIHTEMLSKKCIGGYEFIYYITVLSSVPAVVLFITKKYKIISVCLLLLALFIIILSNYLTALIIFVFTLAFSFFLFVKSNNQKMLIVVLIVFAIILINSTLFYNFLLEMISQLSFGGKIHSRLVSFNGSIFNGIVEEFFNDRFFVMKMSYDSFLQHPFMGISPENTVFFGEIMNLGNHSYIIDTFAIYGLVIGVINCIILIYPFLLLDNICLKPCMFCYISILLFNTVSPSLAIAANFISPYFLSKINIKQKYLTKI
jgi:hypothetical protein